MECRWSGILIAEAARMPTSLFAVEMSGTVHMHRVLQNFQKESAKMKLLAVLVVKSFHFLGIVSFLKAQVCIRGPKPFLLLLDHVCRRCLSQELL
mmetsp:Transcript_22700/g.56398  ORF Transcript_22700/g.56398 Transcript_22700/m.56398 type:complete len:95 (-) Transcript_22700:1694-1978(-)